MRSALDCQNRVAATHVRCVDSSCSFESGHWVDWRLGIVTCAHTVSCTGMTYVCMAMGCHVVRLLRCTNYHVGCQLAACLCIVIGSDGVVSGAQVRSVTSVRVTTHRHFVRASVTDSHRVGVGFSEGSNFYKIRPIFKASNFYKIIGLDCRGGNFYCTKKLKKSKKNCRVRAHVCDVRWSPSCYSR